MSVLEFVSVIISAMLGSGLILQLIKNGQFQSAKNKNVTNLIVLTAGYMLNCALKEAITKGYASISDKQFVAEGCKAYSDMGGNHIIGNKLEIVLALPECPL